MTGIIELPPEPDPPVCPGDEVFPPVDEDPPLDEGEPPEEDPPEEEREPPEEVPVVGGRDPGREERDEVFDNDVGVDAKGRIALGSVTLAGLLAILAKLIKVLLGTEDLSLGVEAFSSV